MKLRSLLSMVIGGLLAFSVLFFIFLIRLSVQNSLENLADKQTQDLTNIINRVIEDKLTYLHNLNNIIQDDANLSSSYILAQQSHDYSQLTDIISEIKNKSGVDVLDIINTDEPSNDSSFGKLCGSEEDRQDHNAKEFFCEFNDKIYLTVSAPLYLYGEVAGQLFLALSIQDHIAPANKGVEVTKIEWFLQNRGDLSNPSPIASQIAVVGDKILMANITPDTGLISAIMSDLSKNLLLAGFASIVVLSALTYLFFNYFFVHPFTKLINMIGNQYDNIRVGQFNDLEMTSPLSEINWLRKTYNTLMDALRNYDGLLKAQNKKIINAERTAALTKMASQVAHDIRSPLTALSIGLRGASKLPEDERKLMKAAVNRIEDIANTLLVTHRNLKNESSLSSLVHETSSENLWMHVQNVISEKRVQFAKITIEGTESTACYSAFSGVQPTLFRNMISNVINNGIEAGGSIEINFASLNNFNIIEIVDTGHGMTKETLKLVVNQRQSVDKSDGHGLGLANAFEVTEVWDGEITIDSEIDKGTKVTIKLPKSDPPSWFVKELVLSDKTAITIVDDDPTVHGAWKTRFLNEHSDIKVIDYYDSDLFITDLRSGMVRSEICLVDFEFSPGQTTGLDLIESLKLYKNAILVTSYASEVGIQKMIKDKNLKMIPKGLIALVPIG